MTNKILSRKDRDAIREWMKSGFARIDTNCRIPNLLDTCDAMEKELKEMDEAFVQTNELVGKITAENEAYREAIDTPPEELARKMFGKCWNSLPVDYKNEQVAFYRKLQVALRALDELRKAKESGKGGGK